jgi:molybdopterin converting factor subunit 1
MMLIKVRLFATLRQMAGWSGKELEAPEGSSVQDLILQLEQEYPSLTLTGRTFYIAVNEEYAQPGRVLQAGDEVALLPPVSGGRGHGIEGVTRAV